MPVQETRGRLPLSPSAKPLLTFVLPAALCLPAQNSEPGEKSARFQIFELEKNRLFRRLVMVKQVFDFLRNEALCVSRQALPGRLALLTR